MKAKTFFDNILSSFFIPGILLISKKQRSGYIIYFLYLAVCISPLFTNILLSFPGSSFFCIAVILLFIISIILNFIKIHVSFDKKVFGKLSMIALAIYLLLGVSIYIVSSKRIENAKNRINFSDKIAYIENYWTKIDNNQYSPKILWNYADKMSVRKDFDEFTDWKPGVYILVAEDTAIIAYQKNEVVCICFDDFNDLRDYFIRKKISIDTTRIYFSFTQKADARKIDCQLLAMRSLGISSLKAIFIRDLKNVVSHACNPTKVKKIMDSCEQLISTGTSRGEAVATVALPLLKPCPVFMIDVDSVASLGPDQRFEYLINSVKKNSTSYGCDFGSMLDFCIIICLPWIAFSEKDFDLADLINGKEKLK